MSSVSSFASFAKISVSVHCSPLLMTASFVLAETCERARGIVRFLRNNMHSTSRCHACGKRHMSPSRTRSMSCASHTIRCLCPSWHFLSRSLKLKSIPIIAAAFSNHIMRFVFCQQLMSVSLLHSIRNAPDSSPMSRSTGPLAKMLISSSINRHKLPRSSKELPWILPKTIPFERGGIIV